MTEKFSYKTAKEYFQQEHRFRIILLKKDYDIVIDTDIFQEENKDSSVCYSDVLSEEITEKEFPNYKTGGKLLEVDEIYGKVGEKSYMKFKPISWKKVESVEIEIGGVLIYEDTGNIETSEIVAILKIESSDISSIPLNLTIPWHKIR
jgi:hypothetical protein